jgi:hypothetical protein
MPYASYRQASKSMYGASSPILKTYQGSPPLSGRSNSRLGSSPANSPGSPMQTDLSSSADKHSAGSVTGSNPPPVYMQTTQAIQQIQIDAQSAAAIVALQNVKNQASVKKEDTKPESPSRLRRKK